MLKLNYLVNKPIAHFSQLPKEMLCFKSKRKIFLKFHYNHKRNKNEEGAKQMYAVMKQKGCFPAGTRIITEQGLVPIQDIKVGDMVLSKPQNGEGELCYKPVLHTVSYEDKEIWELTYFQIKANTDISKLHKGKLLQLSHKGMMVSNMVTPNHPFWVKGLGWTRLDELKNGQIIETHDPEIFALVFMVNPLRKTTMTNVAGSYHPSNVFDADKKGVSIEDVEYFSLYEFGDLGASGVMGDNSPSPFIVNNQEVYVLAEAFRQKVYNFEVADFHNYFVTKRGLWVHSTNCTDASSDLLPKI